MNTRRNFCTVSDVIDVIRRVHVRSPFTVFIDQKYEEKQCSIHTPVFSFTREKKEKYKAENRLVENSLSFKNGDRSWHTVSVL